MSMTKWIKKVEGFKVKGAEEQPVMETVYPLGQRVPKQVTPE